MSVTSFPFIILFGISLIVYYAFDYPVRIKKLLLLLFSCIFFVLSASVWAVLFLIFSITSAHFCAIKTAQLNEKDKTQTATLVTVLAIVINIGCMLLIKHTGIIHIETIGISFYSVTLTGYLLDCLWGTSAPAKNPLDTALLTCYYPVMTSGPILKYKPQMFDTKRPDFKTFTYGLSRILWGFFKKLVISERLGLVVNTIYSDASYDGFYIPLAAILFMFQLYTDFSGCMDIILGVSECYGITLPENFRTPFFSQSVQEYWQRWHITLGDWLRDYILYPILRTKLFKNLGKKLKTKYNRKVSSQITTYLGMLCVWLLIGAWHGVAPKYIFGMGLFFFSCIVLGQLFEAPFKKLTDRLHFNTNAFSYRLFRSLRVLFLVSIGNMFFRLESITEVFEKLRAAFKWNPWIFFDGSLEDLGLSEKELSLTATCLIILLIHSFLSEKEDVRDIISRQNIVFRYMIYLLLLFAVIVFGKYGPGFDAQAFIYRGF